jgi:hypothetical protein
LLACAGIAGSLWAQPSNAARPKPRPSTEGETNKAADQPLTGNDFLKALNRPLLANRDLTPLRAALSRLAEERSVVMLLDRRIDPTQLVPVDVQAPFFDAGIETLVQPFAGVSIVADTVVVAPAQVADTVRTRVALSAEELDQALKTNLNRKFELARRKPLSWPMLTEPRQLLQQVAAGYGLTCDNPEQIPHDLWAAGGLANANAAEAILLIAMQFELEPHWLDDRRFELVAEKEHPQRTQTHLVRGMSPQQALEKVQARWPELDVAVSGKGLTVIGREEEQQEVAVLLGNRLARKVPVSVQATELSRRRFTLRMVDRPFQELMDVLEKQGISVQQNDSALELAGIDLQTRISLELDNATIEQLLENACQPLKLGFTVQGTTISLFPDKK